MAMKSLCRSRGARHLFGVLLGGLLGATVAGSSAGCGNRSPSNEDDPVASKNADQPPAFPPAEPDAAIAEPEPEPASTGGAAAPAAESAAITGDAAEGDAAEDDAGETPTADPKVLLKEAQNPKTKDNRAMQALAEAEQAGAPAKDLSRAAFARGKKLHADPERAATFFRWAAEKDPKYPDPMFELARIAVVQGDVDETKKLLKQVADRKGKKLLQQLEFDPTWEIIKDDPEVRTLLP